MLRCGLLGQKLGHSYSPEIHKVLGGYDYELFEVEPENLASFLLNDNFHGLNVTIPYKKDVIPFCNELSPVASSIGSVNTILRRTDGSLFGDNTDASGFLTMIKKSGIAISGKKVLVLGSGGSSLTVCHVLKQLGAEQVITISRQGEENYQNLERHNDAQVIVNTTPVGMYPDNGSTPVDISLFPSLEGVLDLVYNPARTKLLMDSALQKIPHIGGLAMLVGQARASCELFLGHELDQNKEQEVLQMLRRKMENIVLVGMPGCGKTTVGKILADISGKTFIDCDLALEGAAGISIPKIFECEGEESFRLRETQTLKEIGKQSGLVIATGGGCVTRKENYVHLKQNGVIIFLERPLSMLAREERPLSTGDMGEMYRQRLPLYKSFADSVIQNNESVYITAKKVLDVFNQITNLETAVL
jgi:shikimate dehydrogenase